MIATYLLLAMIALLAVHHFWLSFAAQRPRAYAALEPAFDIREHMAGALQSEGVIFGPGGKIAGRFEAQMHGAWDGQSGTLSESFLYASGARQDRKWQLSMGENGAFTATADDIIGTAKGQQSGATVRMRYRIRLAKDAGGYVLNVTDWLYLMENGVIMNKSEMRKFGIKVAELVATMRPADG